MIIDYNGQTSYEVDIAGRKETLVVAPVSPTLHIASFVLLGNTELTNYCADKLAEMVKTVDFDYIVCPEAKVLPLAQALCTKLGNREFVVFRKGKKAYMLDAIETEVKSITTNAIQKMVVDGVDAAKLKGKKVLLMDDVVSTGGTFNAMNVLISQLDCTVVGYAAALRESDDFKGEPLFTLGELPLFVG